MRTGEVDQALMREYRSGAQNNHCLASLQERLGDRRKELCWGTLDDYVGHRLQVLNRDNRHWAFQVRDALPCLLAVVGRHRNEFATGNACIEGFGNLLANGSKASNRHPQRLASRCVRKCAHRLSFQRPLSGGANNDA
jgi:hypothetical protein